MEPDQPGMNYQSGRPCVQSGNTSSIGLICQVVILLLKIYVCNTLEPSLIICDQILYGGLVFLISLFLFLNPPNQGRRWPR